MARRKSTNETTKFLEHLYADLPGGQIELRFRGPDGKIVKREWCATFDRVASLVETAGAKDQKTAAYYGVAKRTDESKILKLGTKANILGTTTLWADIDTAKHGWDLQKTARALYDLPLILQPNALVQSGGGLHAYWLLDKPIVFADYTDAVLDVEGANKTLGEMVSGDRIFDITRVLRLPGSYNARAKKPVSTMYFFHWAKKDIADLWAAAGDFGKVLGPDGFVLPTDMPMAYQQARKIDPESVVRQILMGTTKQSRAKREAELWNNTRPGGGYPYYGINEAELLSTCNQYFVMDHSDWNRKKIAICNHVFDRVEEVMANFPHETRGWNMDKEYEAIEDKLERWHKQWALLAKQIRKENTAASKLAKENARG